MRKITALLVALVMVISLAACSGNDSGKSSGNQQQSDLSDNSTQQKTDNKSENKNQQQPIKSTKKVLVAYFSHSGNTRVIANQIHKIVGGDTFEIVTVNSYPTDYNACVEQASKELKENYRPQLATEVKNMESYDIVFVGYPNWWGTMPMAVFSFLEKYNLSGKTIIPFCTHEGSRLGQSVSDITKLCSKSTILEGIAIRGSSVKTAENDVSQWLKKIGIID